MSVVSKLPTLVIQKIVDVAAESRFDNLVAWRDALPLLAVCSAWRHAAKAMVYSKAFIESAEMGVAGLDSIDQLHLLDNNLVSNFDIIVATNSSQFVKNIDIAIEDIVCLQALVYGRNLKHYLRTNSWANVASLKIKLAIRHVKHRTNPNYMVHFTHYLNGFCDTVVERVPGVVDIRVSVESRLQLCKNFGGLMLGAYSKQLKSLSCSTEILKGIVELPSQLTKLSITFVTGNRVDLPKLDVRVLEVLELIDAPPEFELVSLSNSEKRTSIEFSNLVSLNLICADGNYRSLPDSTSETHFAEDCARSPSILFPRLENLVLKFSHSSYMPKYVLSGKYCWKNVSSLVLSEPSLSSRVNRGTGGFSSNWDVFDERTPDEKAMYQSRVMRYLLENMPRLSKLALNPDVYFSYDFGYQNLSAGYFADRLASIRIDPISMFDFPQFSRDLVSLRIAATEETWLQFPYLNTRALQYLELSNLPFNRFWQIFQNSSIEDTLMFDNLISLKASFNREGVPSIAGLEVLHKLGQSEIQLSVFCPRLQEIFIKNAHSCGLWCIFANKQNVWSSVSKLRIRDGYYSFVRKDDDTNFSADENMCIMRYIDILNERIVSQVPNVSDLKIGLISGLKGLDYPFSSLISAYSGQLKRLESNMITTLNVPILSSRLHTLDIGFYEEPNSGLLGINIDSLESLVLRDLPCEFSWSWLRTGASLSNMKFSNLSTIIIESMYSDESTPADAIPPFIANAADTDNARLTVYMPLVREVSIDAGRQVWRGWNADIRMNNVSQVNLNGPFSTIAKICKGLTFNSIGVYRLNFESIEKEDEALFNEITSEAFRYPRIRNRAMLTLPLLPFDICLDSVDWRYLTDLHCENVHLDKMAKLLPKLINLKSLDYIIVPGYIPDSANDLEGKDGQWLSTSICTLSTSLPNSYWYEFPSDSENIIAFACSAYLIALIPSAHDISFGTYFSWGLTDIVEKYVEKFPHLSRFQLN